MADRFPLILNTSANQIQEIGSGDQLDLSGNNIANAGIITAGNVTIGAATTDLIVKGDARITGILTIGTSSLKLDGPNNLVNVGTALTLGHTQGLQFHTQNLHSAGFEVNQINASGIITATGADINGDLDVDGHTNLDNVNVSGATTTTGVVVINGATQSTNSTSGALRVAGGAGIAKNVNVGGDLDVDGHTNLDNVNVAGVTTFSNNIDVNGNADISGQLVVGANSTISGDLTLSDQQPRLYFIDNAGSPNNPDYLFQVDGGTFLLHDSTNVADRFSVAANGHIRSHSNHDFFAGIDVTGNATVSGNLSVGGVLTYEDVTNVDSVGIITARDHIKIITDNKSITFGAGDDLSVLHSGSTGVINNVTGDLHIKTTGSGDDIEMISNDDFTVKVAGSETAIQATGDGGVELYNNGIKKFETDGNGITVQGNINMATDSTLQLGVGNDFKLFHNGTTNYIRSANGNIQIDNNSGVVNAKFIPGGASELYHNGTKMLETTSSGATLLGELNATGANFTDDGQSSPTVSIMTDDGSPWALQVGNSTYGNNTNGWQVYVNNTGEGYNYHIGSGAYKDFHFYQHNQSAAKLCMKFEADDNSVELYAGGNKKLETTSSGVTVTGTINFGSGMGSGLNSNGFNINFADSNGSQDMAKFGDSGDLKIYHQSNSSYIINSTGNLNIGSNNQIRIKGGSDVAESMAVFADNGSVELYYDNVKHFETISAGLNFCGSNTDQMQWQKSNNLLKFRDGTKAVFGEGDDLQIYGGEGGTGAVINSANGDLFFRHGSEEQLTLRDDGAIDLYHDNSKKLVTTSYGISIGGSSGSISAAAGIEIANAGTVEIRLKNTSGGSAATDGFGIQKWNNSHTYLYEYDSNSIIIGTNNASRWQFTGTGGHFEPWVNNSYDIGSSSKRVRNIYTNDLNLSNEGGANEVDGTWGNYTIQEGESDLFLINKRNGKKYKFNLTEVV